MRLTLPKLLLAVTLLLIYLFTAAPPVQAATNNFCYTKKACWTSPPECDIIPAGTNQYYGGNCSNGTFNSWCESGTDWKFNYPSCDQINYPCSKDSFNAGTCVGGGATTCTWQQQSCSTTDSCTTPQPYLNPGQCQPNSWDNIPAHASQACQIGSTIYKTCCNSNGTLDGNCSGGNYTGTCPSGTTTVLCGVDSGTCAAVAPYPCTTNPCGASACSILAPTPTPAPTPATTPIPTSCTPNSQGPVCDTGWCGSGAVCAQGHQYCLWDGSGYGACSEEVNNCATQCIGPIVTPTPTTAPSPAPSTIPIKFQTELFITKNPAGPWYSTLDVQASDRVYFKIRTTNKFERNDQFNMRDKFDYYGTNIGQDIWGDTDHNQGVYIDEFGPGWKQYNPSIPGFDMSADFSGPGVGGFNPGQQTDANFSTIILSNAQSFKNRAYTEDTAYYSPSYMGYWNDRCYIEGGTGVYTCVTVSPGCNPSWSECAYTFKFYSNDVAVNVLKPQDAQCISHTIPPIMTAGQTYNNLRVTMKNTGSLPWSSSGANPYRLGEAGTANPPYSQTWGLGRVNLLTSPVNPGSNTTFNFDETAPATAGTYPNQWKMLQEGVAWFGDLCGTATTVSAAPLSVTCSANPNPVTINTIVTWTAAPLGGTGTYTYAWSGTDSLNGTSNPINKTYVTAGTKTGQVTVASGAQTITADCSNSLTVTSPSCPGLLGNCDTIFGGLAGRCAGRWDINPGPSLAYNIWCAKNANPTRGYCYQCNTSITPWIQTTGDVHSNTRINAPGGP